MGTIRRFPLTAFAVLACGFGWMFGIANLVRGVRDPAQFPLGPFLAALVVSAALGRSGLADWWGRLRRFRGGLRWWLVALLAPMVLLGITVVANTALGAPLPTAAQLAGWTALPGTALAIFIAIGIGEEAGWTAFASARLLRRYSFLTAFGIIATVRVLWHVPLMLTGELPLLVGVVANAAFQFLVLWVYQRSGGVWLLAAIWHAVHNTLSGSFAFRLVAGADLTRLGLLLTVVYVAAAGAVLLFDRSVRAVGRPPGSGAAAAGDAGGR